MFVALSCVVCLQTNVSDCGIRKTIETEENLGDLFGSLEELPVLWLFQETGG